MKHPKWLQIADELVQGLGLALGRSKLLFESKDWAVEPHVLFKEGRAWQDK